MVPSNRFQSFIVKPFDISSYTGRSCESKDDFSSMEKVKQIDLFVKRQTHERRHFGFVDNQFDCKKVFLFDLQTSPNLHTDYHSSREKILLPDRFGQILCRIERIS